MAIATFYYPNELIVDQQVSLSSTESAHVTKSRRLSVGKLIQLINGNGQRAQAEIAQSTKKQVIVRIHSVEQCSRKTQTLTIATAIPKGDRQKVMLDMLTQLGVNKIVPLDCEYSVTRFSQNMQEKWQRVCIEACKQSQQAWLPEIAPNQKFQEYINQLMGDQQRSNMLILFADMAGLARQQVDCSSTSETIVLIGPEGGFSPVELDHISSHQLQGVSLGHGILRTETACIAAAAQFLSFE